MNLIDGMRMELEHEAVATRKFLERVPDDKLNWKPHEKSMSLGRLASHLAEIPGWVPITLHYEDFDPAVAGYKPPDLPSAAEMVRFFEERLASGLAAMQGVEDAALAVHWRFLHEGKVMLDMPRAAVLRTFVLSHLIHHRAQLGVYLRLLDVPVPAAYGPTADER